MRIAWTIILVLLAGRTADAARLLHASVEHDGQIVLFSYYDDMGEAAPSYVWRYLGSEPIMVDDDQTRIEPDASDPLQATIMGDILLTIEHGGRTLAQAKLESLKLRRASETSAWVLPAEEVERTATAAGLGPAEPPPLLNHMVRDTLVFFGILVIVLAAVAAGIVSLVRRGSSHRQRAEAS